MKNNQTKLTCLGITNGSSEKVSIATLSNKHLIKVEPDDFHNSTVNVPKETEVTSICPELLPNIDTFCYSKTGIFFV